jgi:CHAT domain-containing protein
MIARERKILSFLILIWWANAFVLSGNCLLKTSNYEIGRDTLIQKEDYLPTSAEINQLNISLQSLLTKGDFEGSRYVVDLLIQKSSNSNIDIKIKSDSYYYIGAYYLYTRNLNMAIQYLKLSLELRERIKVYDIRNARALHNIAVAYNGLGDFNRFEEYSLKSLKMNERIYGESSPDLMSSYSSLIIAYIELQEYEKAIKYLNIALKNVDNNSDNVSPVMMADLYNNFGVCYYRLADFSKTKIYLEKAESIYRLSKLNVNDNYINLINSMALTYLKLGLSELSNDYFERGIALSISKNSSLSYNMINSYAHFLGNSGNCKKGEVLLSVALRRAKSNFGDDSHGYIGVLLKYADYLRVYKIDDKLSFESYTRCIDYIDKHQDDLLLKEPIFTGYSLLLNNNGESEKALEIIQRLLFSEEGQKISYNSMDNPDINYIKPDKKSLEILNAKYEILWSIYNKTADIQTLIAVSNTSELIISLLEKIRINITAEESRLILGDLNRDSYLNAIHNFYLLYSKTTDNQFLEKAFEYSEKSKVAGLLAATRELKAAQFHIPSEVADFEKKLKRDYNLLNARIAEEMVKKVPDTILINRWKDNLLEITGIQDSLILVFENKYPDYYALKYNTQVSKLKDIPQIIGRNGNYINYIASDTILYIFLANRKFQKLLALKIDSEFYKNISQFRVLLSMPSPSDDAKLAFDKYKSTGFKLYQTLIEPIRKYLISDKLVISPDNILSYLPLEALPVSAKYGEMLEYKDIDYMMDNFDISYTYSATFMAELVKRDYAIGNKLIAFAPNYPDPVDIKSLLMNRQSEFGELPDLPYARQEAEFVTKLTDGKLLVGSEAKESSYKKESGNYDIIHLAMHTLLNDEDPMYSTLIFSKETDSTDDSYLRTYEIYGIPLKAKMVVLSSCNTGSGLLYSGEGILSLARGFIYSGSQSVVMSLWEIEDRSGTEIVQMFYQNLKKGYSKSIALKKARVSYLKHADLFRSHPYFWSTLVIYGNNTPLYFPKYLISSVSGAVILVVLLLIYYFRKRKYS